MWRKIAQVAEATVMNWINDNAFRMSAALAYYALFSLAPLLVMMIRVAGWIWGNSPAEDAVLFQIRWMTGPDTANTVAAIIKSAHQDRLGVIGAIAGIGTLLLGASAVFGELRGALNVVWRVPDPNMTWWDTIRRKLFSFLLVPATGLILAFLLGANTVLTALGEQLQYFVATSPVVLQFWNRLLALIVMTLLFAMVYKFIPDVKICWEDVWIGAFVTALLVITGTVGIGLYIGRSGVTSVFGAAGSVIGLLVWIYYTALIFFLGAEFTHVYAQKLGSWCERAGETEQQALAREHLEEQEEEQEARP
ncbi:MAG: YihY/virulence factor BrkB family protein [Bryobacterales bacterium]|nr:YihY/virulence factor BrkB family protein [Bryobacterales bacterium]